MNRLTINLDDDLYALARAHAVATKTSISKAIGDLLRRSVSPATRRDSSHAGSESAFYIDPTTQLPVVRGDGRKISMEEIRRSVDDDDVRHLEIMGLRPKEIEHAAPR